jgi:hypothetical protein
MEAVSHMTSPVIFRDTVSPQVMAINNTYQGVIAYANGRYAWPEAQISRFKWAGKRIHKYDVNGSAVQAADVLDVERYDATPESAPGWVAERWATHSTAAIYCSRNVVPDVVGHLGAMPCYLIVADWTGIPHIPVLSAADIDVDQVADAAGQARVPKLEELGVSELALPPHIVLAGVQFANLDRLGYDLIAIYSRQWLEGQRIAGAPRPR